jgi:uncharacterized membrane protein YkvA (DUF1232 family)
MRLTIELEADDLARFRAALKHARRLVQSTDECDIVAAAVQALERMPLARAPAYIRKRLAQIQRLLVMLEDEAWALPRAEREDVLETLVYFCDPEDLIPDDVSVIGLLDDAIMLELLLRRQRHVLSAYDDFCEYRTSLGAAQARDERIAHAGKLARKRATLQARMRRRAEAAVA